MPKTPISSTARPPAVVGARPDARGDSAAGWAESAFTGARNDLVAFLGDSQNVARVERVARLLADVLRSGGKILLCGNGGSACDAAHFAEELTGRYRADRPPLAAIACTDAGHITCTANDYGFEQVFARWVRALGKPNDVLIVLTTSGNSPNIVQAINAARDIGVRTVGLLGKGGGRLAGACDEEWIVPGETADRVQELHMLVLHVLIEGVEREMWPKLYDGAH